MPLKALLPLLDMDADFYSLQIEFRDADRILLETEDRIRRFDGEINSFMDTAGLIEQMDLVISVCTSVAHLAGAMGKPLWVLLAKSADYRWHMDRSDSPWYPTARLFRQDSLGDWDGLVRQVGEALGDLDQSLAVQALPDAVRCGDEAAVARREASIATYKRDRELTVLRKKSEALVKEERWDEALVISEQAAAMRPDSAEARFDIGVILALLKRPVQAQAAFEQALALKPRYIEAINDLGLAQRAQDRFEEALATFQHGAQIKPDLAPLYGNMGNVLQDLGRLDEALAAFDRAIALSPDYADAYWNKALLLILMGRYTEAWPFYEWRWRRDALVEAKIDSMDPAAFTPQALAGKTVLVRAEQGLGDNLQMLRYVPLLAGRGAKVILLLQAPLYEIARTVKGVGQVIVDGEAPPPHDLSCMIMSLPYAFDATIDTLPAEVPYIRATDAAREAWARRLGPRTRPRIGLVWSGNPGQGSDRHRTMPLATLLPLLDLDADFVSLQVAYREADQALLDADGRIRRFDGEIKTFMDTAALAENLDLVISVCTSVAHLTGALGRPLWVMLASRADYRWHTGRDDSPWYPTARLFRQPKAGEWASVVGQVRAALEAQFPPQG
jgi:tetratricopeptide (TPR) repeat protein